MVKFHKKVKDQVCWLFRQYRGNPHSVVRNQAVKQASLLSEM